MPTETTYKLTTLDFSILGLLAQNPMSGYGIRMEFEKTALASYSSSPGSIYPALKRLETWEMVSKEKVETKNTEVYKISKKGIEALTQWVIQPVTRNDIIRNKEVLLLRFAFMDILVAKRDKKRYLLSFRDALTHYVKELEDFHATRISTMPLSGRQAFEFGLASNKHTIQWIESILTKL